MFSMMIMLAFSFSTAFAQKSFVQIGTGSQSTSYPVYGAWNYAWHSVIYTQAELGGAKQITKIAFDCINGSKTANNQKIYIKHTSNSIFSGAGYEDPTNNGYTLVYSGNITYNGFTEITLTSPFDYNGTDNLIIHYENRHGNFNYQYPNFNSTTSSTNNNKGCGADVAFPTTSGYLNPYPSSRPNIRFYFESANPATPSNLFPITNACRVPVDNPFKFTLGANTTKYDLFLGTSANPATMTKIASDVAVAAPGVYTFNYTTLMDSKTMYYWYVKAKDNAGNADSSAIQYFTTQKVISTLPWNYGFEDSTAFYPGWYGDTTKVDWYYLSTPNWGRAVNNPVANPPYIPARTGVAA